MNGLIYTFADLTPAAMAAAGGKGANLARLHKAGFAVPPGFIIMPAAFRGDDLTPQAFEQVRRHLRLLRRDDAVAPVAVRSSAAGEDSARDSFAGAFETVLELVDEPAILEAIGTVRRSRAGMRAASYGAARDTSAPHRPARDAARLNEMAVVVQLMLKPVFAGVLFTVDALTGQSLMMGNYVAGLGERLVSGESDPATFTLDRKTGAYSGPEEIKPWAQELFDTGTAIEAALKAPQDIEWAISDGKLWLLQARPVTTISRSDKPNAIVVSTTPGDYLWSNGNVGEANPDVMTPSTWSLWETFYNDTMPFKMPGGHPLTANIGGRAYINFSLMVSLYTITMKTQDALDKVQQLLGRLPRGMEVPVPKTAATALLATVPANIAWEIRSRRLLSQSSEWVLANKKWSKATVGRIRDESDPVCLARLWQEEIAPYAMQTFWMLRAVMKHFTEQADKLSAELSKRLGDDRTSSLMSNLAGAGRLESMGPLLGLYEVAAGTMSRQEYMELYGHRGPHEMELLYPRPSEEHDWLDKRLSEIAGAGDLQAMISKRRAEFERSWATLTATDAKWAKNLRSRFDRVSALAHQREAVRSETTRLVHVVREFALKAGELTGIRDDVFFLTLDEICHVLRGKTEALGQIPRCKAEYTERIALPPYPTFIRGEFDPAKWAASAGREDATADARVLILGMPASNGRVEGVVRRLDSADEAHLLVPGEVLVTRTTNVGWTPVFPRAAAIVTDIGAPLSHAAIVARELGIPAVVGCGDATSRLKTGYRVIVDGGRGAVTLVNRR